MKVDNKKVVKNTTNFKEKRGGKKWILYLYRIKMK